MATKQELQAARELYAKARAAAEKAAADQNATLPANENERGLDCGFAWVTIRPARGPLVSYLKQNQIGRSGGYDRMPGYGLWYSDLHNIPTQSMSVHLAAVKACVETLTAAGVNASWNCRYD